VRDALTYQPLAAAISIDGYPHNPIGNNPVTGHYSQSLAAGITYTFNISPLVPGYLPQIRTVGPLNADRVEDFNLSIDAFACNAPGYTFAGVYQAFDATATPPGWSVINNVGTQGWSFNNPGGRTNATGGTGNFAIVDSDNAGSGVSMDTELRTPSLDLSSLEMVTLTFKTDFRYYTGSQAEVADVDVSVNGAAGPWTNVWRKTADYRGPKTETVDLTALAAGQSNVMLRFRYYNATYEWWWQVDDVQLGQCVAPAAYSVSMDPAASTQSGQPGSTLTYTLRLTNTGTIADTYLIALSGHHWPAQVTPLSATLASHTGIPLTVAVTIPLTATAPAVDTVRLTAVGSGVSAYSDLITQAKMSYKVYLLLVLRNF
jgi:hypothetical protein